MPEMMRWLWRDHPVSTNPKTRWTAGSTSRRKSIKHTLSIAALGCLSALPCFAQRATVVGIRGSFFTINGHPTYTREGGFPNAGANLAGTLLNVRAVQAIFDDANYPRQGSLAHPYISNTMGAVSFDYPDGKWNPDRQTNEFIAALPDWRRCGLLAFTVNLQGGGPTDGNFGESGGESAGENGGKNAGKNAPMQPPVNTAFDPEGALQPAYTKRLEKVIAAADRLGMVVIAGLFYTGQNARVQTAPGERYVKAAIRNAVEFLKSLPYRNVLIEINNEISAGRFSSHPILQPEGVLEAVQLIKKLAAGQFPVSASWAGGIQSGTGNAAAAVRAMDYVLIHTNGKTPEQVHETIALSRRLAGSERPLLINEDGVSTFNLHAAVRERTGWGYYDQGWNNYRDGFQSPPTNWSINTPVKWLFFEQVARLTGSPVPPMPRYTDEEAPVIRVTGLKPDQVVKERIPVGTANKVEAIVEDRHPRWPIKRVEFFLDAQPYSYSRNAPFLLGGAERWNPQLPPGPHVLRVVAFDMRGPRFTEAAAILEIPFVVQ